LYLLKKYGEMIAEARWKCLPMEGAESTGRLNRKTPARSVAPSS